MTLTKRQRYDYRDIDWREAKLIKVGHAIWGLYQREVRANRGALREGMALLAACEQVWVIKKQLRAELARERLVTNARIRNRLALHDSVNTTKRQSLR
jgi:hypothetical protein